MNPLLTPQSLLTSPFPSSSLDTTRSFYQYPVHFPRNAPPKVVGAVRFDGPIISPGLLSSNEDDQVVVDCCITTTLPPALTLSHGLESIKASIEKLKLDRPCLGTGVMRFTVTVNPSAKALNWFYLHHESPKVFPVFFISKEEKLPVQSLLLNGTRGIFGIGRAAYFQCHSSSSSDDIKRFLTTDSSPITAYGFLDTNFNSELSSVDHEEGSFFFLVPQIELDEFEDLSLLTATLAWSEPSVYSFDEAILSFESSLQQAMDFVPSTTEKFNPYCLPSTIGRLKLADQSIVQRVYGCSLSAGVNNVSAGPMELMKRASSFSQFAIRLSNEISISNNMMVSMTKKSNSEQDLANINAVWASLIIEECCRLGLTYFCIAPGSRSSPLTIAAARHPLTTCISCFDERSLAYLAVGYARGSRTPAVVITTSGTAVSNLFPAVVEASQDFVPLVLLTADRPPELQDCGANQSINQINHFGSFVRQHFNLPVPSDHIPARMVLTTLDSAVHWATSSPFGPVHVNCPFREPLDGSPESWMFSCLNGLDFWMYNSAPFTRYNHAHPTCSMINSQNVMARALELLQSVNNGLLILGDIHSEDDMWAALLLANHLKWPIVADILSGLRLRRTHNLFPESQDSITFLDHLDHLLLSESFSSWISVDAIIQIGSKITSKRVSQMLEKCCPCMYIMVDQHPSRHDPSHIITHRIHSSAVDFAGSLLNFCFPRRNSEWTSHLKALNSLVAEELCFRIQAECSLTEPFVANMISRFLPSDHAIFIGNSMVIRDVDMYGHNWQKFTGNIGPILLNSDLQYQFIQVAGNRGASGIDGLLSTAIGFAVGSNKQVVCLIGDISFLHDTNALALLSKRMSRKPMKIVVINNRGGAIFSFLPIAEKTESEILDQYFYTSHDISISDLCHAHGIKHIKVQTKEELEDAFCQSHDKEDFIIEVLSCIESNARMHSDLRRYASQAVDNAFKIIMTGLHPVTVANQSSLCNIMKMDCLSYRIPLRARPTSAFPDHKGPEYSREGFIIQLHLEDGTTGLGEVAPFEIHEENLLDAEEQLRFLKHMIPRSKIGKSLALLRGSFSSWIWHELGIPPRSVFPTVRFGLEMAVLNALANRQSSNLASLLYPRNGKAAMPLSNGVKICALLDPNGSPQQVAHAAVSLVRKGFAAIKLKVARNADPVDDAVMIQAVRKMVGYDIQLRVDANRRWTYEEAMKFAYLVKDVNLQYIEEPVQKHEDIIRFCEESGLPVAVDETVDDSRADLMKLAAYEHPGIVAFVIKPSVLGGFETSAAVARWAFSRGKMVVISSAFECGIGLSAHVLFSHYIDLQYEDLCKLSKCKSYLPIAHGLGTYQWLLEDVMANSFQVSRQPGSGYMEASVADAAGLLHDVQVNPDAITGRLIEDELLNYNEYIDLYGVHYSIRVIDNGRRTNNVFVFLHGFLGTGEDWIPIIKAISGSSRCISLDLPSHGRSKLQQYGALNEAAKLSLSFEILAEVLANLIRKLTPTRVVLVGYSMGARIVLYMLLRFKDTIAGAAVLSGSPGLRTEAERKVRRAMDDSRARVLVDLGLPLFLNSWYAGGLWVSLRSSPKFQRVLSGRSQHGDVNSLAKALSDLSTGRQPPMWELLEHCETPVVIIAGEADGKFKSIAREMQECMGYNSIDHRDNCRNSCCEVIVIPDSGHAVHLENPLAVARALRKFMGRVNGH
ncbi:hypothetical protein MLD38_037978 [Melastoma candidum]|uniref:Uncharacterized protein n=1 Tax=Melastoma candidum TaxID=119954 RepID=A0ACB9KXL0_9MYRT|nr:hypothetical protein MLD38_037978 [Melastoma candidum]